MSDGVFEDKPRWPGAPPLCVAANLPAFASEQAGREFGKRNCPMAAVDKVWVCRDCGQFHVKFSVIEPSGTTAGKKRSQAKDILEHCK